MRRVREAGDGEACTAGAAGGRGLRASRTPRSGAARPVGPCRLGICAVSGKAEAQLAAYVTELGLQPSG